MAPAKRDKGKGLASSEEPTPAELLGRITDLMEVVIGQYNQQGTGAAHFSAFKAANPPRYDGRYNPDMAMEWTLGMERVFLVVPCTEEQKVQYAGYMLTGTAGVWWASAQRDLMGDRRPITWRVFKDTFLAKYVPESVKQEKDIEFLKLEQGNLSVDEYTMKYDGLIPYSRVYQMAPNEEWKCAKYESGLRPDIKSLVANLEIRNYDT